MIQINTVSEEKSLDESYRDAKAVGSDLTSNIVNIPIITPRKNKLSLMNSSSEEKPTVKTYSTAQLLEFNEESKLITITCFSDIYGNSNTG